MLCVCVWVCVCHLLWQVPLVDKILIQISSQIHCSGCRQCSAFRYSYAWTASLVRTTSEHYFKIMYNRRNLTGRNSTVNTLLHKSMVLPP